MSEEYLVLKWGTLKAWDFNENEKCREAFAKYVDLGSSISAMAQHDTPEQKQLICEIIDAVDGPISNDWSGESYTKEQAKKYVQEYRR